MPNTKPCLMAMIYLMALLYIPMLASYYLASVDIGRAIFLNITSEITTAYPIRLNQAGWTFAIRPFLLAWQGLWLIYVIMSTCRHSGGKPLYSTVELITPLFCLSIICSWTSYVTWLVLWSRRYTSWSLLASTLATSSTIVALIISHTQLNTLGDRMMENNLSTDIVSTRIFVQNGLAAYISWTIVTTLSNLVVVLTYSLKLTDTVASSITIGILAFVILVWFLLETTLLDRTLRYTCSQYVVFLVALTAIVQANYEEGTLDSILIVVLLGLTEVMTIAKVIIMLTRQRKNPIFKVNFKETSFYPEYQQRKNSIFYVYEAEIDET